jgi:hypothetical protein
VLLESDESSGDEAADRSTGGGAGAAARMSALALAVTLCDSLRPAAFADEWSDGAARARWKERTGRQGGDLRQLAAQVQPCGESPARFSVNGEKKFSVKDHVKIITKIKFDFQTL